jgi:hypothetical protein
MTHMGINATQQNGTQLSTGRQISSWNFNTASMLTSNGVSVADPCATYVKSLREKERERGIYICSRRLGLVTMDDCDSGNETGERAGYIISPRRLANEPSEPPGAAQIGAQPQIHQLSPTSQSQDT